MDLIRRAEELRKSWSKGTGVGGRFGGSGAVPRRFSAGRPSRKRNHQEPSTGRLLNE